MARPTGAEAYSKWSQRVQASLPFYQSGVQSGKDWGGATLGAVPAMQAGIQAAFADGRVSAGIQRAAGTYKQKTLAKASRWQQAVSDPSVQQAYLAGYAKLGQMLDAGDQAIAQTPRGGIAANLQRATAFAMAVHDTSVRLKQTG